MAVINLASAFPSRAYDANGDPASGAKLYVYEAGTTTAVTTYADADSVTTNPSPVVADASGAFGPVYVEQQALKVNITTSADVDLPGYPIDDLFPEEGSDVYDTRADLAAANIDADQDWVETAGYTSAGDGGGAMYVRVATEPTHSMKVQSADGAHWEYVPDQGVVNTLAAASATTVGAAVNAAIGFVKAKRTNSDTWYDDGLMIRVPAGSYTFDETIILDQCNNLRIAMHGVTITSATSSSSIIKVLRTHKAVIEGIEINCLGNNNIEQVFWLAGECGTVTFRQCGVTAYSSNTSMACWRLQQGDESGLDASDRDKGNFWTLLDRCWTRKTKALIQTTFQLGLTFRALRTPQRSLIPSWETVLLGCALLIKAGMRPRAYRTAFSFTARILKGHNWAFLCNHRRY